LLAWLYKMPYADFIAKCNDGSTSEESSLHCELQLRLKLRICLLDLDGTYYTCMYSLI
jgi:hypothetical protein